MTTNTLDARASFIVNDTSHGVDKKDAYKTASICTGNLCGRGVSVVTWTVSAIGLFAVTSLQGILKGTHLIAADSNAIAAVFRKLDQHVLKFCEYMSDAKDSLGRCSHFLKSQVAFIDFVQMASDVYYFGCGKFREERNEKGEITKQADAGVLVAAKVSLSLANTGGNFLWLNEMGFFSLSKAAAAIGEVRLFGIVPKAVASIPALREMSSLQSVAKSIGEFKAFGFIKHVSLLPLVLRGLDLGYALLAIDASNRLAVAINDAQVISASLDLSAYLSELVLSAMVLIGITNVISLGLAGATCIALAASSFLYRATHQQEISQKIVWADIKV
jgi:hypothetical protein